MKFYNHCELWLIKRPQLCQSYFNICFMSMGKMSHTLVWSLHSSGNRGNNIPDTFDIKNKYMYVHFFSYKIIPAFLQRDLYVNG